MGCMSSSAASGPGGGGGGGGGGGASSPTMAAKQSDTARKLAPIEETKMSTKLDENIKSAQNEEKKIMKLLLLGAGSSGKSTFLKQMIEIYGGGFSDSARAYYTPIIYTNIIHAMKLLLQNVSRYGVLHPTSSAAHDAIINYRFPARDADIKFEDTNGADGGGDNLGGNIARLWNDGAIQEAFAHGHDFHLPESCKYFFDRISTISSFGYVPTTSDILRIRAPTNGIVETSFQVDGNVFKMFDVGGQRNQRKKWIHCFDNVTAVLFVAAISEYNQSLFEDERTNRLVEALTLFGEVCNAKWFRRTALILFLNKRDLFEEKLESVPFRDHFPDYDGENKVELVLTYIEALFRDQNENDNKKIFVHVTCATDTDQVRTVFEDVRKIIINKSLQGFGLA